MDDTTIAAIATPFGSGGIGIIKISGPDALGIAGTLFRSSRNRATPLKSHRLYHGHIVDPHSGGTIDEVLLGVMRAPRSYTREDVVEINAHSGSAALSAIFKLVLDCGAQPAQPGEFTKRAFLNGRIDLTQAEAVNDMISARTETFLKIAAAQLGGEMKRRVGEIRSTLMELFGAVAAAIDFPEDTGDEVDLEALPDRLEAGVVTPLRAMAESYRHAHILRDGIRMAIVGRPNVGKSSLMNRLIQKERVIVTPVPGTTRDLVEESLNLKGVAVTIADTAGLHETQDPVEKIGVEKTRTHMEECDLVVLMLDAQEGITDADRTIFGQIVRPPLVVINKIDLVDGTRAPIVPEDWPIQACVPISAKYDRGIDLLRDAIVSCAAGTNRFNGSVSVVPSLRQKEAIVRALEETQRAADGCRSHVSPELVAEHLRCAVDALGEITGETVRAETIDDIFDRFCIGK